MSMMLFVLSIEPLIRAIENEPRIKGISPPKQLSPFNNKFSYINQNKRFKIFEGNANTKTLFFADDGTFFNTREEIPIVREITNIYCNSSGAKINNNKSYTMNYNNINNNSTTPSLHINRYFMTKWARFDAVDEMNDL